LGRFGTFFGRFGVETVVIGGIDEAGRGPVLGPLVVAGVAVPEPNVLAEMGCRDSKVVSPERDVLFLRYYSKFETPYEVVGSSHNGSMISAHYFIDGNATPGVRADGMNKFLVNYENWRGEEATPSPGDLNVYVYQGRNNLVAGNLDMTLAFTSPTTWVMHAVTILDSDPACQHIHDYAAVFKWSR